MIGIACWLALGSFPLAIQDADPLSLVDSNLVVTASGTRKRVHQCAQELQSHVKVPLRVDGRIAQLQVDYALSKVPSHQVLNTFAHITGSEWKREGSGLLLVPTQDTQLALASNERRVGASIDAFVDDIVEVRRMGFEKSLQLSRDFQAGKVSRADLVKIGARGDLQLRVAQNPGLWELLGILAINQRLAKTAFIRFEPVIFSTGLDLPTDSQNLGPITIWDEEGKPAQCAHYVMCIAIAPPLSRSEPATARLLFAGKTSLDRTHVVRYTFPLNPDPSDPTTSESWPNMSDSDKLKEFCLPKPLSAIAKMQRINLTDAWPAMASSLDASYFVQTSSQLRPLEIDATKSVKVGSFLEELRSTHGGKFDLVGKLISYRDDWAMIQDADFIPMASWTSLLQDRTNPMRSPLIHWTTFFTGIQPQHQIGLIEMPSSSLSSDPEFAPWALRRIGKWPSEALGRLADGHLIYESEMNAGMLSDARRMMVVGHAMGSGQNPESMLSPQPQPLAVRYHSVSSPSTLTDGRSTIQMRDHQAEIRIGFSQDHSSAHIWSYFMPSSP